MKAANRHNEHKLFSPSPPLYLQNATVINQDAVCENQFAVTFMFYSTELSRQLQETYFHFILQSNEL